MLRRTSCLVSSLACVSVWERETGEVDVYMMQREMEGSYITEKKHACRWIDRHLPTLPTYPTYCTLHTWESPVAEPT